MDERGPILTYLFHEADEEYPVFVWDELWDQQKEHETGPTSKEEPNFLPYTIPSAWGTTQLAQLCKYPPKDVKLGSYADKKVTGSSTQTKQRKDSPLLLEVAWCLVPIMPAPEGSRGDISRTHYPLLPGHAPQFGFIEGGAIFARAADGQLLVVPCASGWYSMNAGTAQEDEGMRHEAGGKGQEDELVIVLTRVDLGVKLASEMQKRLLALDFRLDKGFQESLMQTVGATWM